MSKTLKALVAAAALAATTIASATPIIGTANLTFGLVRVTIGNIDWNPSIDPPPNLVPTFGNFFTSGGANSGSYAAGSMAGITQGQVHDLSANPADANYMPIGAGNLANMFKFDAHNGVAGSHWMFTALSLSSGSFAGAPYLLTESTSGGVTSTSATLSVTGLTCDDTNNDGICQAGEDKTNFVAILSAQYPGQTIAGLTATLLGVDGIPGTADDGALPNNTWSGTLTSYGLPEPTSVGLVGLALAGLGFVGRRRQAK
jgi:hypothetical protein